jgi:hypothetical protein
MTLQSEDDAYQSQIYANMQEKDTDELLEIWEENDRSEWTDEAFQAVRSILLQRLGRVPEQGEPRDEYDALLDEADESQADYPTERKLIWIAELARNVSWLNVGVAVVYALYRLMDGFSNLQPVAGLVRLGFMQGLGILLTVADGLVFAGVIFVLLQAVAEIIYLIMDIRELVEPEDAEPSGLSDASDPARNG